MPELCDRLKAAAQWLREIDVATKFPVFAAPWKHGMDERDRVISSATGWIVIRDESTDKHFKKDRGDAEIHDFIVAIRNISPMFPDVLEAMAERLEDDHSSSCGHWVDDRCNCGHMALARAAEALVAACEAQMERGEVGR